MTAVQLVDEGLTDILLVGEVRLACWYGMRSVARRSQEMPGEFTARACQGRHFTVSAAPCGTSESSDSTPVLCATGRMKDVENA